MELFLSRLISINIASTVLILVILLIRTCFRNIPKRMIMVLWFLLAFRLMCPVSFHSRLSLIPITFTAKGNSEDVTVSPVITPVISSDSGILSDEVNIVMDPNRSLFNVELTILLPTIWFSGVAAIFVSSFISYLKLKRRLRESPIYDGNIILSNAFSSPFVIGLFRPMIVIPTVLSYDDSSLVIAHERLHILRHDHQKKAAAFFITVLYWYNPLIWIAFRAFSLDLECTCDEAVINDLGTSIKKKYAAALIRCSVDHSGTYTMLSFSSRKASMQKRVYNILKSGKKRTWAIIASTLLCSAVAVTFLTDPLSSKADTTTDQSIGSQEPSISQESPDLVSISVTIAASDSKIANTSVPTSDTPLSTEAIPESASQSGEDKITTDDPVNIDKKETEPTAEKASPAAKQPEPTTKAEKTSAAEPNSFSEEEPADPAAPTADKPTQEAPSNTAASDKTVVDISLVYPVDPSLICCEEACYTFWEDDTAKYIAPNWGVRYPGSEIGAVYSDFYIVTYSDGSHEKVVNALNSGRITGADLIYWDIGAVKKK